MRAALRTSAFVTGYMGKMAAVDLLGHPTPANDSIVLGGPTPQLRTTAGVKEQDRLQALEDSVHPSGVPSWMVPKQPGQKGYEAPDADGDPYAGSLPWDTDPVVPGDPTVTPSVAGGDPTVNIMGKAPPPGYTTSTITEKTPPRVTKDEGWNWNTPETRGGAAGFGIGAGISALLDWSRDKPISVKRMLLVGILGGAGGAIFQALGGWDGLKETIGGWKGPQGKRETLPYTIPPGTKSVATPSSGNLKKPWSPPVQLS